MEFSDAQLDALMRGAHECVLTWITRDGWPVGVAHAFVWHDGSVFLTFAAHRHRAAAIRGHNRVSVAVSGASGHAASCPQGVATMLGRAYFCEDQKTRDWFFTALSEKTRPNNPTDKAAFRRLLESPLRVVVEIVPERWISYDQQKGGRDMIGLLDDSEKFPRKSVEAIRLNQARAKLGRPPR